jgi:geranylgeranyl diphosphate synthase type I
MDTYEKIQTAYSSLPHTAAWPEMDDIFRRNAAKQPHHWRLPILACEAVGGKPEDALPAAAALGCQHISILLIDDMLDADPRGEHHQLGMPAAANLATAFQAAGYLALVQAPLEAKARVAGLACLQLMTLQTALGQHWDTQSPENEDDFWQMVKTKSAPFFGAVFYLGALSGGAAPETANQLERLGRLYGELIQVHDDLKDVFETPAGPDWAPDRAPLPILFATLVEHPERDRFLALRSHVWAADALREAQEILCRCGAVAYCVDQILGRADRARDMTKELELPREDIVQRLIDDLVVPVVKLFEGVGVSAPVGVVLDRAPSVG